MSTPRRYELTDFEWSIIQPLLPNKPRGKPRVDDRKVLNGIYWRLRTGSPWDDIPERYGPPTTCANRFRRWAKIGVWDRILAAVSTAYDGDLQMIDAYGFRHVAAHDGKDIALSASVLIDGDGIVRWTSVTRNVRVRPDPGEALAAIDRLGAAQP